MFFTKRERRSIIRFIIRFILNMINFMISIVSTAIISIIYLIKFVIKYIKICKFYTNTKYSYMEIQRKISKMNGREFEFFCNELLKELGYKSKVTNSSNDGGKDIIAKKNNKKYYVECKRWSNQKIGREQLQKLIGSAVGDNIYNAIFITTSQYNNNAINYAGKINGLELWDMIDIMKKISKLTNENINRIFKNTQIQYDIEQNYNKIDSMISTYKKLNQNF